MPFSVPVFLGCGVIHHVLDTSQIMAEFVFIQFESLSILGKKKFLSIHMNGNWYNQIYL